MTGRYDGDYVARLPEGSRQPGQCGPRLPIGAPRAADERQNLNQPAAASYTSISESSSSATR